LDLDCGIPNDGPSSVAFLVDSGRGQPSVFYAIRENPNHQPVSTSLSTAQAGGSPFPSRGFGGVAGSLIPGAKAADLASYQGGMESR
jgi:hypothetical protein